MKTGFFSFFASYILILTSSGCANPEIMRQGAVDDGGFHLMSQYPEKWLLVYNRRVENATARDIQRMDMAYKKAQIAMEQTANLYNYAVGVGLPPEQAERIVGLLYWESLEPPRRYYWYSEPYFYGYMSSTFPTYYSRQYHYGARGGFFGGFRGDFQFQGSGSSMVYGTVYQPPVPQARGGTIVYGQVARPSHVQQGGNTFVYPNVSRPAAPRSGGGNFTYPVVPKPAPAAPNSGGTFIYGRR